MKHSKLILGVTGPSVFSSQLQSMIEGRFNACPIYINQNDTEDLDFIVSSIDGLILGGGCDIHPMTYGNEISRTSGLSKFDIKRDKRELYLIDACIEKGKPILAICRGLQIVGVRFGYYLMQDISRSEISHSPGGDDIKLNLEAGENAHFIECLKGHGDEFFKGIQPVNSFHHQALLYYPNQHNAPKNFEVIATANTNDDDKKNNKIVEILQSKPYKIIACQFHPEADYEYGNITSNLILDKFQAMLPVIEKV